MHARRTSHVRPRLALAVAALLTGSTAVQAQNTPIPTEVASAVDRGLAWLARNQEANGSWAPAAGGQRSVAVTGLCGMAFMARGHVPGQGPYGEHLNRAVDYVISQQREGGLLAERGVGMGPMYDHGIATIMLCEAYGMLDDRRQEAARGAINRSVNLILAAQRVPKDTRFQGGWRYQPNSDDADISVSGWQLMALRAAANAGAVLPPDAIENGIAYIRKCAIDDGGGGFGYLTGSRGGGGAFRDGTSTHARTGTGVLALILMGKPDDPLIRNGAGYLVRKSGLLNSSHHYYTLYYCAQAAWQLGGTYWTQINADVSGDLRRRQQRDGSWTGANVSDGQGPNYATAMAILALTVPYRYLPLYQR